MINIEFIQEYLFVAVIILLIWSLYLNIKYAELTKRFNKFTRKGNTVDLEKLIEGYTSEADKMKKNIFDNIKDIEAIKDKSSHSKGNVEIMRYNAFQEGGQDLSFSIAFLDDYQNGVVITSIYNRGASNTYAKPIEEGNSLYKLSDEEKIVLERVKSQKK